MNSNVSTEFDANAVAEVQAKVGTDVATFRAYDQVLDEKQRLLADAAASKFDPKSSPAAISGLGAGPMKQIADLSVPILEQVRMRSLGATMGTLRSVLQEIDKIDFEAPEPKNWLGFLDPFKAWLRGLESVEKNLQKSEIPVMKAANAMLERANWFATMRAKLEKEVPGLYIAAGTGELVVDREDEIKGWMEEALGSPDTFAATYEAALSTEKNKVKLTAMKKILDECRKPSFQVALQLQRSITDRMRGRTMDLHEQALFAVYMQPVMLQSEVAAMTAHDSAMKEISQTFPKIRVALAAIIAQKDIQDAQDLANEVEAADAKAMKKLAESLGKTNDSVVSAYEVRKQKIEETRALVEAVKAQILRAIEIDKQVSDLYGEALNAYGEITDSIKTAG